MERNGDGPIQIGDRIAGAADNAWIVIALLFLVFGVVGLPLIWISKAFPTWAKIMLTFVVAAYTAALVWGTWLIVAWCYGRIIEAL